MAPHHRTEDGARRPFDLARLIAQFCATYPGELRGGAIEAPLFFLLCRQMQGVLALDRVQQADAVMKGAAVVMVGEQALPALAADRREAFGGEPADRA